MKRPEAPAVPETPGALPDGMALEALRAQMLRFATLQLGDADAAEDAVQEALLGAMRNADSFGGRAALKTWVFAILRHKIADELRRRSRMADASRLLGEDEEAAVDALFDARGMWQPHERPQPWRDPDQALEDEQFWQVFETCLDHLPARQARVFMAREFVGLAAPEICASMEISPGNLNVLMHRARLRLRECLENRWFAAQHAC